MHVTNNPRAPRSFHSFKSFIHTHAQILIKLFRLKLIFPFKLHKSIYAVVIINFLIILVTMLEKNSFNSM